MLTGRDHAVLRFIKAYRARHHLSPTLREIGRACFISSTSAVAASLHRLQQAGCLKRRRGVPRSITLPEPNQ
jgi:SOS-response transcriptional repressor LexA